MGDLDKLKLLIFESKYPYFSDEELQNFLTIYDNDVYYTAAQLCLMKMDMEKSIKVGPITIENPDPSYWQGLANKYSDKSEQENGGSGSSGYYPTYMNRADEL
ncbi:hypothetical protein [Clostridium luticellarii]|mgnify:CR=1 FL=1|uniref:Uncharacterized protein n=1 Tax=Clostridium luticellarii TaxID=1691940 RepID=A0A2T0BLJ5_9CLOT|nr:hypothetical protein [Clostridium luticellarii]PRR84747.1 hypothetical protein CLLU_22860 [Clostridium luticellarii]